MDEKRPNFKKMLSTSHCEVCGAVGAGATWFGHWRCEKHWEFSPEYGGTADGAVPTHDWRTGLSLAPESTNQFSAKHWCYICGARSVAISNEGWVCADHRCDPGLVNEAEREGTGSSIP